MRRRSREEIIAALCTYAARTTGPLTLERFQASEGFPLSAFYALFPRGWFSLLEETGLKQRASKWQRWSGDEVMAVLDRIVRARGRFPTWAELARASGPSRNELKSRFGGIEKLRRAYAAWRQKKGIGGPVPGRRHGRRIGSGASGAAIPRGGDVQFGRPLAVRGVAHEPTNELGVVHLFGALCETLGFVVTRMGQGFPDCEAMRCVDRRAGRWERVRVELEFRSSNFLKHGHDVRECDLIVCWEHDWTRCPLEVIELRKVFGGTQDEQAA